jgi:hypothetical protein
MEPFYPIIGHSRSFSQNPVLRNSLNVILLGGLYALGIIHWLWFFNGGKLTLQSFDWPKEVMFLEVLQESLQEGRIPFHIQVSQHYQEEFSHLRHGRFLGLPETLLSPQILLLPFMKLSRFILVHNLILYSLGFLGSLLIRKRFGISLIPFAVFFVLFNFNGYITAHLGAGHAMWSGYFLLPFFGLYVLEALEDPSSYLPALKLALTLFAMLLQGSFHMVNWCWMFVGLVILFNPRWWKQGFFVLGFSGFLAAFRLIPTAIAFWGFRDYFFIGGYPTLADLLDAFLVIRDSSFYWPAGMFNVARWWEYDLYVGMLGLAMMAYFGIYKRFDRNPIFESNRYAALDMPLVILAFLALQDFYAVIYNLPIPLLNSERVSSRFMIVPVVLVLLLATIRMQRLWENENFGWKGSVVFGIGIVEMFFALVTHSSVWNIARMDNMEQSHWHQLEKAIVVEQSDPVYYWGVIVSLVISVLAMMIWSWLRWRFRGGAVPTKKVANCIAKV